MTSLVEKERQELLELKEEVTQLLNRIPQPGMEPKSSILRDEIIWEIVVYLAYFAKVFLIKFQRHFLKNNFRW
jgi:hypothetical protein